uniref:Uncharacterized protein n=1 Tax=viral metagenome TaxID=1070528 RepID=A0A6M3IJF8_9ZZZZ
MKQYKLTKNIPGLKKGKIFEEKTVFVCTDKYGGKWDFTEEEINDNKDFFQLIN